MPKITSSIGSRNIDPNSGMRKFTVSDESMSDDDFDNPAGRMRRAQMAQEQAGPQDFSEYSPDQIAEMRRQKIQDLNRISGPAKQRAEILIGIGRAQKDVIIASDEDAVTFSIRTLKGRESKFLMRHAASLTNGTQSVSTAEAALSVRDVILASSIYAIDGVSFDMFLNLSNRLEDDEKLAAKILFIEELDDSVITHLYNEYSELTKNNVGRFAVKNEADAKEVSESISKSGEGNRP